jgi:hypothetical protein
LIPLFGLRRGFQFHLEGGVVDGLLRVNFPSRKRFGGLIGDGPGFVPCSRSGIGLAGFGSQRIQGVLIGGRGRGISGFWGYRSFGALVYACFRCFQRGGRK